jgi:hypothetical protein
MTCKLSPFALRDSVGVAGARKGTMCMSLRVRCILSEASLCMRVCVCLRVQLLQKDPNRKLNCKRRLGDASDTMHRAQRDMHIVPFCVPTAQQKPATQKVTICMSCRLRLHNCKRRHTHTRRIHQDASDKMRGAQHDLRFVPFCAPGAPTDQRRKGGQFAGQADCDSRTT